MHGKRHWAPYYSLSYMLSRLTQDMATIKSATLSLGGDFVCNFVESGMMIVMIIARTTFSLMAIGVPQCPAAAYNKLQSILHNG